MSSNSPVQKRDSIVEKIRRFLFGDDIFISYSRVDSTYALALANELTKNKLSCFLDQWGTPPGERLPKELINTIKRCSTMVLVGSKNAADSENVGLEVKEFLQTRRPIIPITFVAEHLLADASENFDPQNLTGTLEQGEWYPLIAGIAKTTDTLRALKEKMPSENVILRIVNAAQFRSRSRRLRKTFFTTLAAIFLLLLIGGWAINNALIQVSAAQEKTRQAETNANLAADNQKEAEDKLSNAQSELSNINQSLTDTKNELVSAGTDLKLAKNKINRAENQLNQTRQELTTSQSELTSAKNQLGDTKKELQEQIVLLRDARIKTEAARIVSGIGQDKNITATELNLIWNLSTTNVDVRYSFIEQVFESPVDALRFSNRAELLTHAAVGLSEERRDHALDSFILPRLRNSSLPFYIRLASVDMAAELGIKNTEWAILALPIIVEAIEKTNDQERRDKLADELLFVTGQLKPEQISPDFYKRLINDAEKKHKIFTPGDYKAIEAVLKKLTPDETQSAFTRIIDAMKAVSDEPKAFYDYHFWAAALSINPGELSPEHRKIALGKLIANINVSQSNNDYIETDLRQDALKILIRKVKKDDLSDTIGQLMTTFYETGYEYEKMNLSDGLKEAAAMLTPEAAPEAMNHVLKPVLESNFYYYCEYSFPALEIISGKMSGEDKKAATEKVLQVLKQSLKSQTQYDSEIFAMRSKALGIISPTLSTEDAEVLLNKMISIVYEKTNDDYYQKRVQALFALVNIANPKDAHRILMAALNRPSKPDFTGVIVNALGSINDSLSTEELQLIYDKIIEVEVAPSALYGGFAGEYLRDGVKSIARKVSPEEAGKFCTQLSNNLEAGGFSVHIVLAVGLASLPAPACGAETENALQIIATKSIQNGALSNTSYLEKWSSSVKQISGKLTFANSQIVLNVLLGLEPSQSVKDAVKIIIEKSEPKDVPALISQIIADYRKMGDEAPTDDFYIHLSNDQLYRNGFLAQTIALLPCESNQDEIKKMWRTLFDDNKSLEKTVEKNVDNEYKENLRQMVKEGIVNLAGCLSPTEAPQNLEFVVDSLKLPASTGERDVQVSLLPAIAKRVSNKDTPRVFTRLMELIGLTTDRKIKESLVEAVGNLEGAIDLRLLIDALMSPVCVGRLRSIVINKLEKETNNNFDGSIWTVIKWAQAEKIDVSSPPEKPSNH